MLSANSILSLDQGKLLAHLKNEDDYYAHFAPPEKAPSEARKFWHFLGIGFLLPAWGKRSGAE